MINLLQLFQFYTLVPHHPEPPLPLSTVFPCTSHICVPCLVCCLPSPTTPDAPWGHHLCLFCLLNIYLTPRTGSRHNGHAISICCVSEFPLDNRFSFQMEGVNCEPIVTGGSSLTMQPLLASRARPGHHQAKFKYLSTLLKEEACIPKSNRTVTIGLFYPCFQSTIRRLDLRGYSICLHPPRTVPSPGQLEFILQEAFTSCFHVLSLLQRRKIGRENTGKNTRKRGNCNIFTE